MINKELISLDVDLSNRKDIISFLAEKAFSLGYITDLDTYIGAVENREKEFSTSIGYGVSIPHGKSESVNEAFVAFMRVREPIIWDNGEQGPVSLIFLIGVPENKKETLHLKILAQISRRLIDEDFRCSLMTESEESVFKLLIGIEENIE